MIYRFLLYTFQASGGSFVGCAILQYERIRASYSDWSQNMKSFKLPKLFGFRQQVILFVHSNYITVEPCGYTSPFLSIVSFFLCIMHIIDAL
jgi:hypothetical protein